MPNDTTSFKKIYIAAGYTDYPRSIIIRGVGAIGVAVVNIMKNIDTNRKA